MPLVQFQLDSRPEVNRDLSVQLTQAVTGRQLTIRPFLDGTASVPNLDAGDWRLKVSHPNLIFNIADRMIRVFRDRPTFIPIKLPKDILENAPIRDTPEADYGPVRAKLEENAQSATIQARKLAGQPIYADDWNELASTVAATARATSEITGLAAPNGHDHPELVAKIDEIQRNLQRITDLFGAAINQLRRAQQIDALRDRTDAAVQRLAAAQAVDAATLQRITKLFDDLAAAGEENPATFATRLQATAAAIDDILEDLSARRPPIVREDPDVRKARDTVRVVQEQTRARTHVDELTNQQRFYRDTGINPVSRKTR